MTKKRSLGVLRKVVDCYAKVIHVTVDGIEATAQYERLECGHEQRRKEDICGPTNANRRRCRQCRPEAAS